MCGSYYNEMIYWSNDAGPVKKRRHCVLAILLGLLRGYSVMNKWIKSDTIS